MFFHRVHYAVDYETGERVAFKVVSKEKTKKAGLLGQIENEVHYHFLQFCPPLS